MDSHRIYFGDMVHAKVSALIANRDVELEITIYVYVHADVIVVDFAEL